MRTPPRPPAHALRAGSRRLLVGDREQHAHALRHRESKVEPPSSVHGGPQGGTRSQVAASRRAPEPDAIDPAGYSNSTAPAANPAAGRLASAREGSPRSLVRSAARSIRAGRRMRRAFRSSARRRPRTNQPDRTPTTSVRQTASLSRCTWCVWLFLAGSGGWLNA